MSNIYIQEPPTNGKVLLNTTVGDIDIELWSKETPKACRNFVQLCMEGYYDGTLFHRVVKGFIAQGGDPNGDGTGGESIYGKPFKDEFHSRLRFVRRGLVAMANGGKDDNGSQFFFTLGPCQDLQNKHTIFGKVAGDTLYNMLKLEECIVDKDERPLYPHKIISAKVLSNPFPDIVPRTGTRLDAGDEVVLKPKDKPKKNFSLLSFGDEAEEEETETDSVAQSFRGKSKSSHDLTNDPKLSSVSVSSLYDLEEGQSTKEERLESVKKKLKSHHPDVEKKVERPVKKEEEENEVVLDSEKKEAEREKVRKQINELKKELRRIPKKDKEVIGSSVKQEEPGERGGNAMLDDYHKQLDKYAEKSSVIPTDREKRSKMTLELLDKFKRKLYATVTSPKDEISNDVDDDDDDSDNKWLAHKLVFEGDEVVAKDANVKVEEEWYDITDPRNPINQRRREKSQKQDRHHDRHHRSKDRHH